MNWFKEDHAIGRAADSVYRYTEILAVAVHKWLADLRAGLRNPPHHTHGHLL